MPEQRLISIVGRKNSGKTTLITALTSAWERRNHRVTVIKHASHPTLVDREGTDSRKIFDDGNATRVILDSPNQLVMFERQENVAHDPAALARRLAPDSDLVLFEGYKRSNLPRVEIHRSTTEEPPLFLEPDMDSTLWLALVTDSESFETDIPVFRFTDTGWMLAVAALAWNGALILA